MPKPKENRPKSIIILQTTSADRITPCVRCGDEATMRIVWTTIEHMVKDSFHSCSDCAQSYARQHYGNYVHLTPPFQLQPT